MSTTIIGLIAAFLTTGALVPQAYRAWKTRSTDDISLGMYLMMVSGTLLWLIYGLLRKDVPIIFANGVALVFSSMILSLKIRGTKGVKPSGADKP